jgi:diguanylate cyclase (GGDEF)-like protein
MRTVGDWVRLLLALPKWLAVCTIVGVSVASSVGITMLALVLSNAPSSLLPMSVLIAVLVPTMVAAPVAIGLLKLLHELNSARALAQTLANTDALTGALNRRNFLDVGTKVVSRARRDATPTSVLLMDIDDFKQVNDRHGHGTGDAVLQMFAQECLKSLRPHDMLARWGGEEFVALLPATAPADAVRVSERLCKAIADGRINGADGMPIGVTVSIGVAASTGGADGLEALLSRADAAMYVAKRNGKNGVRLAT